jgi:hypothetical protein
VPSAGEADVEDLEAALDEVNAYGLSQVDTGKAAVPADGSSKADAVRLDVIYRIVPKEAHATFLPPPKLA